VVLCWIPSHVGIIGNELADAAAIRSANAHCTRRLSLPARDFYRNISVYLHNKWQSSWDAVLGDKLKVLKPRLGAWQSCSRRSRREEVILCRLRLGHTYFTHRYLLCSEERPVCPRCGDNLSVAHIFSTCCHLRAERRRFFGTPSPTLVELLGDGSRHVAELFQFCT